MSDLIERRSAVDAPNRFTKDCNPEHFVGHSNFIEYMDTVGIRSFGNWQYANGFNMGLTAAEVAIEKLPSAQQKGKWIYPTDIKGFGRCPHCKALWDYSLISNPFFKFCPRCGNGENELTELKGEEDERIKNS